MHSIRRKLLIVLTAVLVFGAVGSASASASAWYAGGTELTSAAPLVAKTGLVQNITISYIGLETECGGIELKSADILPSNGGEVEHLVFTGCHMTTPNCTLSSTAIESKPLTMEAALGGKSPEDTLLLKPTAGTTFMEFKLEGERCGLAGKHVVTGNATFTLPQGREEAAEQYLNVHTGEGELKMSSAALAVKGEVKLKLVSGKSWSFH